MKKQSKKQGKKRSKLINIGIPLVLLVIIAISVYRIVSIQLTYKEANDEYAELNGYAVEVTGQSTVTVSAAQREDAGSNDVQVQESKEIITEYPVMNIDYQALLELNDDFKAWIRIPVLDVSYPVTQGNDNEHYLHYTYENKYNSAGCIFIDYENAGDFSDRNTFVYGHNMKNGSMFGCLKRFRQEEGLCASDPYFYIYTQDAVYKYCIFSYYTTDYTSDRYMLVNTEAEYDYYVESAMRYSEYVFDETIDFAERPNIVTLSTCSGSSGTKRMVVHGALIGIYENEE